MKLGLVYAQHPNFGDMLNEDLFAYLGFEVGWAGSASAEASGIGSILGWQVKARDFEGLVLGSGMISAEDAFDCPRADFRLIRGPLTKSRIGAGAPCAFGDPGLLLSRVFPPSSKRGGVGFAPHYQDQSEPAARELAADPRVKFIDVTRSPREVAAEISSCEHLVASSLHAVIAADSYQVPSTWVVVSALRGGEFKFHDYFQALGYDRAPVPVTAGPRVRELIRAGDLVPGSRLRVHADEVLDVLLRAKTTILANKVRRKVRRFFGAGSRAAANP